MGLTGASTKHHPAPFPIELAERLTRMFSFVGDTVFDPFMGTGTTNLAAAKFGRNSIGVEVDPEYFNFARKRLSENTRDLFSSTAITVISQEQQGDDPNRRTAYEWQKAQESLPDYGQQEIPAP
jgi:DNA modification methylase